jgi:hypothetical protein
MEARQERIAAADLEPGSRFVRKAQAPARQIAINAGEDGSVIVGKILEKDQYGFGFDSQSGEYANLVTKGIIDLTKVVRAAIQNAASANGLLRNLQTGFCAFLVNLSADFDRAIDPEARWRSN